MIPRSKLQRNNFIVYLFPVIFESCNNHFKNNLEFVVFFSKQYRITEYLVTWITFGSDLNSDSDCPPCTDLYVL